jgi:hypothetical protein
MEFHYTVIYDSDVNAWSVEPDPSMYYPDGHMYNKGVWPGWSVPMEGSPEEALDVDLLHTLQSIACTFPVPQEA